MMFYSILILEIIVSIYINHLLYYMIILILFNLSIYCYIYVNDEKNINYRCTFNYIIISCICYYIYLLIVILFNISSNNFIILSTILILIIFVKFAMYPYMIVLVPIYENIPFYKFMLITILTKLLYGYWVLYWNLIPQLTSVIIITFVCTCIISLNTHYTLLLIVLSSTFQISYIIMLYLSNIYQITIIYFIFYSATWYLLYISLITTILEYRIILFILIYTYVGIPPFFGFYLKVFTFSCFAYNYLLVIIIISTIISTYMYINLYNRDIKFVNKRGSKILQTIFQIGIIYILPIPFDILV